APPRPPRPRARRLRASRAVGRRRAGAHRRRGRAHPHGGPAHARRAHRLRGDVAPRRRRGVPRLARRGGAGPCLVRHAGPDRRGARDSLRRRLPAARAHARRGAAAGAPGGLRAGHHPRGGGRGQGGAARARPRPRARAAPQRARLDRARRGAALQRRRQRAPRAAGGEPRRAERAGARGRARERGRARPQPRLREGRGARDAGVAGHVRPVGPRRVRRPAHHQRLLPRLRAHLRAVAHPRRAARPAHPRHPPPRAAAPRAR
ncbi:MAG: hypothetical protein AVDCRST_MAG11-2835, partial [uncultured Gemmatimonadaceae bacterium]